MASLVAVVTLAPIAGAANKGGACRPKWACPTTTTTTTAPTSTSTSTSTTVAPATSTSTTLAPATSTSTTLAPAPSSGTSSSGQVLWGAWMEGTQTYTYYYGGTWQNAPWDTNTWSRFEQNAGKRASLVHYGQPPPWEQAFQAGVGDLITSRGAIPFMDMSSKSVSLRDIANGVYDSSILTWAKSVKAWNKSFLLRWNWEMNGTWFPWGAQAKTNAADYVASWRHFHDLVASVGANNVTWVWCPNVEPASGTPLESVYPGDAYVDWTCMDGYNWGGSGWQSFTQIFQQTYNHILSIAPSKPMMIGETGSVENGGSKAQWITDAMAALPTSFPAIRAVAWFNWRIYERSIWQEWPIESSATSQAAFAKAISSSRFTANTFGTQTGSPVAAPG
jgi:hypothetical protein